MRRRHFFGVVAGAAAAWPLAAGAQQALPVVGFLGTGSPESEAFRAAAVRQGLSEAGFVEGQNVAFEYRWAGGQYERLPALAAELVRRNVTVIVAIGGNTTAVAAKPATSTTPIIFALGGDPIKLGLVASLNRPGGNITGVSFLVATLAAKQFELLHETVPNTELIGYLKNPNTASSEVDTREILAAAEFLAQKVQVVEARTDSELEAGFAALVQQRAGALVVGGDPFFLTRRVRIVELAARNKLPAIYPLKEYAAAGGLMSYGTSITEALRIAGVYAGRILKGEKAADLPVQQSTKFDLVVNLKAAKALGLTVPPTLLARADEVIE